MQGDVLSTLAAASTARRICSSVWSAVMKKRIRAGPFRELHAPARSRE